MPYLSLSLADWLVVSVLIHYVIIGVLYWQQQGSVLCLGLYLCYACANVFLIAIAMVHR